MVTMTKEKPDTVNILVVGIGFHARRIYIPVLQKIGLERPVKIKAIVDIAAAKQSAETYISERGLEDVEMLYVEPLKPHAQTLSKQHVAQLNALVARHNINGVVISTDPVIHRAYAEWALSSKLHILMDKPISTRVRVSSSRTQAKRLIEDYDELLAKYQKLQKERETIFSVMVQRRYETGYQKVFELIKEVGDRFQAPVTSIQASHSDGVWILPDEIVEQVSHPYSTGYGKNSHSGYHIFDIIWQFYKASGIKHKSADSAEVMTSFINPRGLLKQFGQEDFHAYFPDYLNNRHRSDEELWDVFDKYGEIDAFSIIRLLKDKETICNISTNLIHNGFSRRAWSTPSKDLYKGNGRVKHQSFSIQQGPFQNIQIHQYQSSDQHDDITDQSDSVGGNNHFDIFVFRNAVMFGPDEKPFRQITLKSLQAIETKDTSRLYNESAKDVAILEFVDYILGKIPKTELKSNITSHEVPVKIMSTIYQSQARQLSRRSPVAGFKISEESRI